MILHSHYCMSIHLAWYICISIYIYVPVFYVPELGAPNCRLMAITYALNEKMSKRSVGGGAEG